MRLEEMTTFTPDPPQDDIPVQVGVCKSDEYLPRQRKEQQCQENLPREREEYLPRECEEQQREEYLPREREEQQREENLSQEREEQRHKEHLRREREGPDREEYRVREGWEHGGSECENEGDIFNAETLLHFLKTIGEFNLSNPYLETPQTPATTDAIMSTDPCAPTIEPKATTAVPQTPTTTDATYYIHPFNTYSQRRGSLCHSCNLLQTFHNSRPINTFLRTYRRINFTRGGKRAQDKESVI